MNDTLLKIIERYELDKPIMMSDKLDIIWDKSQPTKDQNKDENSSDEDPEAVYERVLRETMMTAEEAYEKKQEENERRNEERRKRMQQNDNVNQYAVKHKLEKRKVFRANMNAKQIKIYYKLLEYLENRKKPMLGIDQATQVDYVKLMEVERAFMDALSIVVQSGYFLEEQDFMSLIQSLRVSDQSQHVV